MGKSLKEYITALGYWGLIVIAPIILDIIGVIQLTTKSQFTSIPSWVWFQIAFVLLLIIPFIAFHKLRIKNVEIQKKLDVLLEMQSRKQTLDGFIAEGNQIQSGLPNTLQRLEDFDKYSWNMDEWATNVRRFLAPLGWEAYFTTNPGLNKEEKEDQDDQIEQRLSIARNYMKIRLQRLLEIRRQLGD